MRIRIRIRTYSTVKETGYAMLLLYFLPAHPNPSLPIVDTSLTVKNDNCQPA
jgi:hypothetical protein